MNPEFKAGDLVILKSDEFNKQPVIMTISRITPATNRVDCSYSENGKIITKTLSVFSLVKYLPNQNLSHNK